MAFIKPRLKPDFFQLEKEISSFWKSNKIFEKSVENRKGKKRWTFYDGPPFISGTPHYGHIKDQVVKDAVPRYWTMKGYYTPRKWGWDCHGLPIESKVEKKLNIKSKLEIENKFGVDKYINECYSYTRETSAEWYWYIEKMGRWCDYDHAYRTMDQDYMESVWWVFKTLFDKGLIYKGWRSSLYSTDSATPVSNFEIAMDNTYEEVEDDSVTAKFKLKEKSRKNQIFDSIQEKIQKKEIFFLSWTTTPWTLPANFALAVNKEEDYAIVETYKDDINFIKSWLIKDIPFDYQKQEKVKIEQYYLSLKGEKVLNQSEKNFQSEIQIKNKSKDQEHKKLQKNIQKDQEILDKNLQKDQEILKYTHIHSQDLTEIDIYITKINKKFYFVIDNHKTEITQKQYQQLAKLSPFKPIKKTRYYYKLIDETDPINTKEGVDIKKQMVVKIDMYEDYLKDLNLVEIEFSSLKAYKNFLKIKPEWFGQNTDVIENFGDFLLEKKIDNRLNAENISLNINDKAKEKSSEKYKKNEKSIQNQEKQIVILGLNLAQTVLKYDYKILKTIKGKELIGLEYEQLYKYLSPDKNDLQVVAADFVTTKDGTGITHIAPAYGDADFELAQKLGISIKGVIDNAGNILPKIKKFAGMYLRDAALPIINDLKSKQRLYDAYKYVHRLPFYRYKNPLIYKAQKSWFIDIQKLKKDLIKQNEFINWVPDHLKEGRFKKGIESAPDWSISRSRFWATTMPVWVEAKKENPDEPIDNYDLKDCLIIGSRDELRDLSIDPITKVSFIIKTDQSNQEKQDKNEKYSIKINNIKKNNKTRIDYAENSDDVNNISDVKGIQVFDQDLLSEVSSCYKSLYEHIKDKSIHELDEKKLEEIFQNIIPNIKQIFEEFLKEKQGKDIEVKSNSEILGLIKHIFEGKTLKESISSIFGDIDNYSMYFKQIQVLDLHKIGVDKIKLKDPETGKIMVRIPEVLDVWMDSGSMSFARDHYPFEKKQEVEESYPADYIVEYIAQTRAWFYVMHVIGVAVKDQNAFKNVVTSGVIAGNDGRKMSKTYGNYPDPKKTLQKYGAETIRWFFLTSNLIMGEDISFDEKNLKEQLRMFLLPLWNIYLFFVTYANLNKWSPSEELISNDFKQNTHDLTMNKEIETYWYKVPFKSRQNKLDHWLIALLQKLIHEVRADMDDYLIPKATRKIQDFIEKMSKWYIRLSRDRFSNGDNEAFETFYYTLIEVLKLSAPFVPFITENIYQNLVIQSDIKDKLESIHLTDYPKPDMDFMEKHDKLLSQMESVSEIVSLGQSIRTQNQFKVRQPLQEIEIILNEDPTREKELENWMKKLIASELNVKKVEEKQTKLTQNTGWIQESNDQKTILISLDTNLTPQLKKEGLLRELLRKIQAKRKRKGLKIGESIDLELYTEDQKLIDVIKEEKLKISQETSSKNIKIFQKMPEKREEVIKVNKAELIIKIN